MVIKTFSPKVDRNGIPHYGRETPDKMLEKNLQIQTADYLRWKHKDVVAIHIANERSGKVTKGQLALLARQGMRSGASDWLILKPCTAFIELKVAEGTLKKTQIDFLTEMQRHGFPIFVCWSLDAFRYVIEQLCHT